MALIVTVSKRTNILFDMKAQNSFEKPLRIVATDERALFQFKGDV